jgi:hypothetical protein
MRGRELVASEFEVLAGDEGAGEDGFALSGFPEFVRSGDGFWGDASRELEGEELTDIEVAGVAAEPSRAAGWALVTHTGLGSFGPAPAQSSSAVPKGSGVIECSR